LDIVTRIMQMWDFGHRINNQAEKIRTEAKRQLEDFGQFAIRWKFVWSLES
jgi:hypothetical protein